MCQPGRPSPSVGRPGGLVRLGPLPEGEVADVVLAVLVGLDPLPHPELVRVEAGETAVRRPRVDPEEDRAVVGPIGVALRLEGRDEADDVVDVARRSRQHVRRRHPEGVGVGQEPGDPAVGELLDGLAGGARAADDLVVDVGQVHDPRHPEAAVAQVADEQVGEQERPEVPDVGRPVDRGAAGVDPDVAGLERLERADLARERVPETEAHAPSPRRGAIVATAAADSTRPGALRAVEVAGRGLHAHLLHGQAQDPGDRAAHRLELVGEPRPRARDREIDRLGPPAGLGEPPDDRLEELATGDAPGRPAVGREEPPEVAQRRRPEERVGDRMEGHVPVRVAVEARRAGDLDAPETERLAGPEGVRIGAHPDPPRDAAAEEGLGALEIGGHGHLEVHGVSGDGMDGDCTGLQQRGLIGEPGPPGRGKRGEGATEERRASALGRLRRDEVGPIDRLPDPPVDEPLQGVGDRHDGQGRAVLCGCGHDGRDERRADEGPRPVVDQDDRVAAADRVIPGPQASRAPGTRPRPRRRDGAPRSRRPRPDRTAPLLPQPRGRAPRRG